MASEIRVNKIENRSGLGTVTFADTGVDLAGIVTATTFSGSGASLTNLPAANVTGTLPAISGANLTNVPASNVVGVHTSLTVTNATTTGTAVVGGGVTISESGIEASGIGITVANINGSQIGGRRNIIINGAMMVAQRGTSSTTSGYGCVDRIQHLYSGTDEAPTFSQADVASGTTPYSLGFRKSIKVTNGNQTSGAGAADFIRTNYIVEAQDVVNSGWDITSPSSFATFSFWVKSSVAQNFYGYFYTYDGTPYYYPYETGSLTADTWTKITKTIPGNSNVTVDNNNGGGINIALGQFWGTDLTASPTLNQWAAWSGSARTPDYTSTWYTPNDATFEMTGLQLEVGSQATAFEHRSFGEELRLCKRYYQTVGSSLMNIRGSDSIAYSNASLQSTHILPEPMRASPTGSNYGDGGSYVTMLYYSSSYGSDQLYEAYFNIGFHNGTVRFNFAHNQAHNSGNSLGTTYKWGITQDGAAFDAEL